MLITHSSGKSWWGKFGRDRAVAHFNKKNFDRAIEDASKAIALKLNNPGAYNNRGNSYNSIGNRERAIEDYSKAIDLSPEDADYYTNRGYAYFLHDENDKAVADYRKALKLQPENETAKSGLLILGE